MIVTAGSTQPLELPNAGTYVGRLFRLVELGSQPSTYNGQTRDRHVLLTTWELLDEQRRSDGTPFELNRRFTLSMHPKAAWRQLLETLRGTPYGDGEKVDLRKVAGAYGLVSVTLDATAEGKTFANVGNVVKLPKGMPKPPGYNPLTVYFIDDDPDEVLLTLPEKLQALIVASPEYKAKHSGKLAEKQPATVGDMADDVPW